LIGGGACRKGRRQFWYDLASSFSYLAAMRIRALAFSVPRFTAWDGELFCA
jgi:2-hydroxychromene-2-carboxylate isomerase